MASFFYCGRLSSAQLHVVPLQAPKHWPIISPRPRRTDGIPERHQRQWIINPSLQICAWNFNRTGQWIKELGKNPFTHSIPFTYSLTAVPFVRGAPKRVPSDSEKHRRVYTSSNVCHSHEWRVDTASGMTLKKQNACLHAVRHAVEKKLRVYTASEAKGLMCIWANAVLHTCTVNVQYRVFHLAFFVNVMIGTILVSGNFIVRKSVQKS